MKLTTLNLLILLLGIAATAILVSYAAAFHSHPWGGPDAWGSLGDYVGGLLNPIVGIVTVVLVRETLKTTREEAESSRIELRNQTKQLELQVRHAQGEAQLNDIKRRMDGVLKEWEHEMAQPVGFIYVFEAGEIHKDNISALTVRDYLTRAVNPGTFANLKNRSASAMPNSAMLIKSCGNGLRRMRPGLRRMKPGLRRMRPGLRRKEQMKKFAELALKILPGTSN